MLGPKDMCFIFLHLNFGPRNCLIICLLIVRMLIVRYGNVYNIHCTQLIKIKLDSKHNSANT